MSRTSLLSCLVLLIVAFVAMPSAAEKEVPRPLRAAILIRAVGYEKGFADRSGEAVIAVVLTSSGDPNQDGKAVATALTALLEKTRIAGRQARVVQITHSSESETATKLSETKAEIVYMAQGLERVAGAVPTVDGQVRRIVACSHGSQMQAGCVLGVELSGEKPRLVVNLKQANSVGLRFQPELLRLARVIR